MQISSWGDFYRHHAVLIEPLLENWEKSSTEKERLFSLTFYALLRSRSALICGVKPEKEMVTFEKRTEVNSIGLTKIEKESHPYPKCLLAEWKKQARPLIFKSCKYYFTH